MNSTPNATLVRDSQESANYYLKKLPEYSVLVHQISELESELKIYEKNNNRELIVKTTVMIKQLKKLQKEFGKIIKGKSIDDKPTNTGKIEKSEKLKSLEEERNNLYEKRKNLSANAWITKIKDINLLISDTEKSLNFSGIDFDFDDAYSVDNTKINLYEKKIHQLNIERNNIFAQIADIIGYKPSEVIKMKQSEIRALLEENLREEYENINDTIDEFNLRIAIEKDKISDNNSVKLTDLVFSVLNTESQPEELKNEDSPAGKQAREMLAIANIPLVNGIAYYTCKSKGKLNYFNDAVSAGLLGLSLAINVWYQKQIIIDQPLPFKTFAGPYITSKIKEEIDSLSNAGRISGTNYSDKVHYENKRIKNFINANKELFQDIDEEQINTIVDGLKSDDVRDLNSSTTQSDLSNTITGGEDDADVWANIGIDETYGADEILEMQGQYKNMMKSVITILGLFSTKTLSNGEIVETTKPLFDKYDRKIFLMHFGLIKNIFIQVDENTKANRINAGFTQEEIANHIWKMKIAEGELSPDSKPISQEAISARIKTITEKLQKALEQRPDLVDGFEYFFRRKAELDVISQRMEKEQINHFANKISKKVEVTKNETLLDISISNGDTVSQILSEMDGLEDNEIYDLFDQLMN